MKLKNYIIPLIAALLITMGSCNKDVLPSMSATVDGVEWSSTVASVIGATSGDYITILGVNVGGQKIFLGIKGSEPGKYSLQALEGEADVLSFYLEDKDDEENGTKKYTSSQGTVNITKMEDNRITGTFNFTGVNSLDDVIEITDGKFTNVLYI